MTKKLTQEEFIAKAKLIHPQYDYSKVEYINCEIKVKIICPKHGEFEIRPARLTSDGNGCSKCGRDKATDKNRSNTDAFIAKAKLIHPQYDYSKVEYINSYIKVKIICPKHGEFEVRPTGILQGKECKKCAIESTSTKNRYTKEEFIARAKLIHPQYDYSKVEYTHSNVKVKIICPKHREFEMTPHMLLVGRGCPSCNESKGEKKIAKWLDTNNIEYVRGKRFDSCRNKRPLPFDFYIESKNILIEFDGEQHFRCSGQWWGGEPALQLNRYRDSIKTEWASANGYNLIRLDYRMTDNEISEALAFLSKFQ